jgi:uncharacterized protein HemX
MCDAGVVLGVGGLVAVWGHYQDKRDEKKAKVEAAQDEHEEQEEEDENHEVEKRQQGEGKPWPG